jgi:glycopeptide antibiotics resistance protein
MLTLTARAALAPYLVALALIVWLPADQAGRVTGVVADAARLLVPLGVPFDVGYTVLEILANIALFVPFGALLLWSWPRLRPWHVLVLGLGTSVVIELVQFAIPSRFPTLSDVVANGTGALVGAVLARLLTRAAPAHTTPGR